MGIIKFITYTTSISKVPFTDWFDDLDTSIKSIIIARLDRLSLGNFGDCKFIKNCKEIYELRIWHGPGYRIYFGKKEMETVVLLIGGNKNGQSRDIAKAKRYWQDYKESLDD